MQSDPRVAGGIQRLGQDKAVGDGTDTVVQEPKCTTCVHDEVRQAIVFHEVVRCGAVIPPCGPVLPRCPRKIRAEDPRTPSRESEELVVRTLKFIRVGMDRESLHHRELERRRILWTRAERGNRGVRSGPTDVLRIDTPVVDRIRQQPRDDPRAVGDRRIVEDRRRKRNDKRELEAER